jgi:hypothetical protein
METIELTSVGKLACELQVPVVKIRRVAESLGIVPSMRLNDVDHFAADDCERIAAAIAEKRA